MREAVPIHCQWPSKSRYFVTLKVYNGSGIHANISFKSRRVIIGKIQVSGVAILRVEINGTCHGIVPTPLKVQPARMVTYGSSGALLAGLKSSR